jgi:hypothetical protein
VAVRGFFAFWVGGKVTDDLCLVHGV